MRKLAIIVFLSFVLLTGMIVLYSTSRSRSPSAYIYSAKGLKRLKKHPAGSPEGCGVDVMIMRHCEKGTLRAHCTKEGLRRAEFLATLFGDTEEENIPKLSNQLGCGPNEGCPEHYPVTEFDALWSLRYLYSTPDFSSKKSGKVEKGPIWTVSGSVQKMGFDIVAEDKKARLKAEGV
ncbi:hypothetical protein TrRE_jg7093 [Triparma retinervis]|uniref:Uncharacterized protein n=1 Tax=Triparma retinervis TaxID=2557542 RepID=A0A9W7CEE6_9STRA|nr:hypothetical protein TrRE_jg7093 [Triparma retinervis]